MPELIQIALAAWEDHLGFDLEPEDIEAWIADTVLDALPE